MPDPDFFLSLGVVGKAELNLILKNVYIHIVWMCKKWKGLTWKGLDCAHPLVLNNGAPVSWSSSINGPSPKNFLSEATAVPLFNGNRWANIGVIQPDPLKVKFTK